MSEITDVLTEVAGAVAGPAQAELIRRLEPHLNVPLVRLRRTPGWRLLDSVPLDDLVLDAIAMTDDLFPKGWDQYLEQIGAVNLVHELPLCDRCGTVAARYDVFGPADGVPELAWYACEGCRRSYRPCEFSRPRMYLMTYAEVSPPVRELCDVVTAELGRPSLWSDGDEVDSSTG